MIDRRREGDEPREEFKVLGSTGNVRRIKCWICEASRFLCLSAGVHRNHWPAPLLQLYAHRPFTMFAPPRL
jgi:hypothetical protein